MPSWPDTVPRRRFQDRYSVSRLILGRSLDQPGSQGSGAFFGSISLRSCLSWVPCPSGTFFAGIQASRRHCAVPTQSLSGFSSPRFTTQSSVLLSIHPLRWSSRSSHLLCFSLGNVL